VATEYGGTSGGSAWHGAQPPYPGPLGHGDLPESSPDDFAHHEVNPHDARSWPPDDDPPVSAPRPSFTPQPFTPQPLNGQPFNQQPVTRQHRTRLLAFVAIALGTLGFVGSLWGLKGQVLPRQFSAAQQQQITNWEYAKRWRLLPAGTVFPAIVKYAPPAALEDDPSLSLAATRIGIARQDTCKEGADPTAAAVLDRDGCTAMVRATYEDSTSSYVVTVGAAVMPGVSQAAAAARALAGTGNGDGLESGVRTVPFAGTAAAAFTNPRRQLAGAVAEGSYVVLYSVGYADSRPHVAVSGDSYADGEMTSVGMGVEQAVRQVLGAPVAPAHCPGAPGC